MTYKSLKQKTKLKMLAQTSSANHLFAKKSNRKKITDM